MTAATASSIDVARINERLEGAHPSEALRWAVETVTPGRLIVVSSFGSTGMVNLHLLSEIAREVPVVFVDTLYHFPETLEHAERVKEHYGLEVRVYRPAESRAAFEKEHGEELWERDLDLFHQLTRVEPMKRALQDVDGWITGRRRDQSDSRSALAHVEIGDRIKINPVASWSADQVWSFLRANGVPYNPLHDMGYLSLGDQPLTTPVSEEEHERAGRWRGSERLECGIHGLT
ncbi:MAG TPA: phosphoadenylyl-sulfate reductase [Gemmatimonadetes bacterium]|nr:phosphoadenylyl-sulfate reductase [Gemmatimonadota bacterium]